MTRPDWTDREVLLEPATWAHLFLSFEGRIPRRGFWAGVAVLNLFGYIASRLASDFLGQAAVAVVALAFLYPALALAAKRSHDRGRSEAWLLVFFVPVLAIGLAQVAGLGDPVGPLGTLLFLLGLWVIAALILLAVDLGLLAGEPVANRYGEPPGQPGEGGRGIGR
ncbi:DUF805 domain-containing protein [Phreatobacter sp.]|uniref:DUF805 domain-containing protein n=1 Tax=Phreatobacter sp. TaxID=1966341 RepID=UPI003F71EDAB